MRILALLILLVLPGLADTPAERLTFAAGASSGQVKGTLNGYEVKDYIFTARAGQKMRLEVDSKRPNWLVVQVRSPGNADADVFSNFISGDMQGEAVLPSDGDYRLRLGIRRPEAARGGRVDYLATLAIEAEQSTLLEGSGSYLSSEAPAFPVGSVNLALRPDGHCEIGVNLPGDGFHVSGTWVAVGDRAASLKLTGGFANTGLRGQGVVLFDESHRPTQVFLGFEATGQNTHHSLTFLVK
ncbi:MAG: hypothetical protein AB7S38_40965 [Vulcanimicrobiota bacterium]